MSIRYITDDSSILDSPANVLVAPVNCRAGVMGAGLAKAFADRWPELLKAHSAACSHPRKPLRPGQTQAVKVGHGDSSKIVIMMATKDHWRWPSKLEWVAAGLADIGRKTDLIPDTTNVLGSIAIPAVGCGLGGLEWIEVYTLIVRLCEARPEIEWFIYPPKGAKS